MFVLFSLIPVALLVTTTVFICFIGRKNQTRSRRTTNNNNFEYANLATTEDTAVYLDNENDDLDEDMPIIGRQNE